MLGELVANEMVEEEMDSDLSQWCRTGTADFLPRSGLVQAVLSCIRFPSTMSAGHGVMVPSQESVLIGRHNQLDA
jgi:hypothetical protein